MPVAGLTAQATSVAAPYAKYPVPKWRQKFVNALNQIKEVSTGKAEVVDPDSREPGPGNT